MLEHYFVKPATVDRIRAGWLAPQIESYVEWMHREGYADRNIFRRVPILCHFADFARRSGATDLASAALKVGDFRLVLGRPAWHELQDRPGPSQAFE